MNWRSLLMGEWIARHHGSTVSKLFPVNPRGRGGSWPSRVHCVHAGGTATEKATKRSSQFVKTAIAHDKMTGKSPRMATAINILHYKLISRLDTCQFSTLPRRDIDSGRHEASPVVRISEVNPRQSLMWWPDYFFLILLYPTCGTAVICCTSLFLSIEMTSQLDKTNTICRTQHRLKIRSTYFYKTRTSALYTARSMLLRSLMNCVFTRVLQITAREQLRMSDSWKTIDEAVSFGVNITRNARQTTSPLLLRKTIRFAGLNYSEFYCLVQWLMEETNKRDLISQ